jgi:predicted ATPase
MESLFFNMFSRRYLSTSLYIHHAISQPLVSPQQRYDDLVSRGVLRDDQDQRRIIARIQRLYEELVKHQPSEIPKSGNRGTGWVRCPGVPIAS